jgi:hypothetical protein
MHKKHLKGHRRPGGRRTAGDEGGSGSSRYDLSPEEKAARKRVREIKGYYEHLTSYVGVNLFLFFINIMVTPDFLWCLYPMLGWGIGLATHTVSVFGFFGIGGKKWEEQKVQEMLGQNATREELERLSERIESLATIVSSVNWETLDPEIARVNGSLLRDSQNIQEALNGNGGGLAGPDARNPGTPGISKERLVKMIETLESIVTSPEFKLVDRDRK